MNPSSRARTLALVVVLSASSLALSGCKILFWQKDPAAAAAAAPTVTAVSPTTGASIGGTTIALTGTGFASGATIWIDSTACASSTIDSDTSATCVTPAGVGTTTSSVILVNPDAQAGIALGAFTYSISQVQLAAGLLNPAGLVDGASGTARFNKPVGSVSDGTYLYVADTGNNVIRKITLSSGAVTTFAGDGSVGNTDGTGAAAEFNGPRALAIVGSTLYVADTSNHLIRAINLSTAAVTTLASGIIPYAMTTDGNDLYIYDSATNKLEKVATSNGAVTVLSGSGASGGQDNNANSATYSLVTGMTYFSGSLYIASYYGATVRQIWLSNGASFPIAGHYNSTGSTDNATGTSARFGAPSGITNDGVYLYVTDGGADNTIRRVEIGNTHTTTTIANAASSHYGNTDATGSAARFYSPGAITFDSGKLYISDTGNSLIRSLTLSNSAVTTLSGFRGGVASGLDGTGTSAQFGSANGLAAFGSDLLVTDGLFGSAPSNVIRKLALGTGVVSTLSGVLATGNQANTDGSASVAQYVQPGASVIDGTGTYMYITDFNRIRRVTLADGTVTTVAGQNGSGHADGVGASATFTQPSALELDSTGANLYVADSYNYLLRKIDLSSSTVSTYVGQYGVSGSLDGIGTAATIGVVSGMARVGSILFIADQSHCTIRLVDLASAQVAAFAGTANLCLTTPVNGSGTSATFMGPTGLTTDGVNLYVADTHIVRQIVISSQEVTTLTGSPSVSRDDSDGALAGATFSTLSSIRYVPGFGLYVANGYNIRRIY